jgi:glycosyltransferase involved in cell wall biosynthesis
MKLLFYIQSLAAGGAQRVVATMANHWAMRGWEIVIVTVAGKHEDFYSLDERVKRRVLTDKGAIDGVLGGFTANLARIRRLRRILRAEQPQAAIAMMDTANVVLAMAGLRMKDVLLIGSERIFPPHSEIPDHWKAIRNWGYRYLDAVVAQTSQSADWLAKNSRAQCIRVIPNPIELPLDRHDPFVAPDDVVHAGRTLLSVGRLVPQKNFGVLIEAFSRVAADAKDWNLVIVGEGSERTSLSNRVASLGLEKRISLPGKVGNVGDWYSKAHLYAMTSLFEGFPNTLLEALAHGVPAVSFDCDSGPNDIVREGVDGFLVRTGDVDGLADQLRQLMLDEGLRSRFASRAADARTRFKVSEIARAWESLFLERGVEVAAR